ncbi:flavonol synthase [Moniliophthora roreri MCA 2997]|uniref:Flavonol synthase n=1 Tax=Moniliophthora roreri (strain MCA 2997) TaxID=1381753 RepID=V2X4P0_MONRO|nr:flavonol synthase [Moniliophthora roreri MCA 2997]
MGPQLPPYKAHPPTKYKLDYAPLATIDISSFNRSPEDDTRLAAELIDASHNTGFWVVTGHGITDDAINRQLSIGQAFFALPIEEKREFPCDFENGSYLGYREPVRYIADTDVKENHEALNIAKFTESGCRFPLHQFCRPFESEIAAFQRKIWESVLRPICILLAIGLELPEDYFVKMHEYDKSSEDYLCYKIYHPRTDDQWATIKDKFRPGHTDFGSMTLVFSGTQTVSGLQIRTPNGTWKHVESVPGGITVNAGDTLAMITNGYIKSTVHGVVRPPPDQDKYDRLALLYFLRLLDDAEIGPAPSPLLKRIGWLKEQDFKEEPVQGSEWLKARIKAYNHRKTIESVAEDRHFDFKGLQVQVQYDD